LIGPGEVTGHVNATADHRLHEHQDAKLMGPNGALVDNLTGFNIPAEIKNADQMSKDRDAARTAAGKPPLEGD